MHSLVWSWLYLLNRDNFLLIYLFQKAPRPLYNHKESDNVIGGYVSTRNKSTFTSMIMQRNCFSETMSKTVNQSINMFWGFLSERLTLQMRCCMQMLQVRQKQCKKLLVSIYFNKFFNSAN